MEPPGEIPTLLVELTSGDDDRAMAAVQKLSTMGAEAIPGLRELLAAEDSDTRWWTTWALGEISDPQVPGLLCQALHDPEVTVRQAAALALRQRPDPVAIVHLVAALGENDSILLNLCVAALVAIGKEAVPKLLHILENGASPARMAAARALAMIGDESALPALMAALGDQSHLVEFWATQGLERMGPGVIYFETT
jgi:HEAT repeat protein